MSEFASEELRRLQNEPSVNDYPKELVDRVLADIAMRLDAMLEKKDRAINDSNAIDVIEVDLLHLKEKLQFEDYISAEDLGTLDEALSVINEISRLGDLTGIESGLSRISKKINLRE